MRNACTTIALSLALVASATEAQTRAPQAVASSATPRPAGARDGDRALSCADIGAERAAIYDAVAKKTSDKAKAAKVKKGLFGFAKTFASVALPGMMGGLGGTSMLGSLAAQSAGASAGGAINAIQVSEKAAAATPSADQQARLERLDKVGTFRRCAP